MRGQLDHLAAVSAQNAGLVIHMLPFTSGAHAVAGTGPATVLRFVPPSGLGAVYLDGPVGGQHGSRARKLPVLIRPAQHVPYPVTPDVNSTVRHGPFMDLASAYG
jgi:Domain of unknown function (DUF5753)